MFYRSIALISGLLLLIDYGIGQINWREAVIPAFLSMEREVEDSVVARRSQSEMIRGQMVALVNELKFDRAFIFGLNEEFFKEGMHQKFTSAPRAFGIEMDRDEKVIRLENLHVELYRSDRALFRWLEFKTILTQHPDRSQYSRWANEWNELLPSDRPNPRSIEACQKWVKHELACDLANSATKPTSPRELEELENYALTFVSRAWDTIPSLGSNWKFPFPSEGIFASFPMHGQYAFNLAESIRGIGYLLLPREAGRHIHEVLREETRLLVRWTSTEVDHQYTIAKYNYLDDVFYFLLPESLRPETVHHLELIAVPTRYQGSASADQDCWADFRGAAIDRQETIKQRVPGEVVITELFFRTGKYTNRERLQTLLGKIDLINGAIHFETDEPFDQIEIAGTGYIPGPVDFNVMTTPFYNIARALYADHVNYYLTVPLVEVIENIPENVLLISELDHTSESAFIHDIELADVTNFPDIPDFRDKETVVPGGYIIPPYQITDIKDSFATAEPLPFITQEHFYNKTRLPATKVQCTLYIGDLQRFIHYGKVQQDQLRRRIEERAHFFYNLARRRAVRQKTVFTSTLEDFRKFEEENLPQQVSEVLNAKFPDVFKDNFTLVYIRKFPGTDQLTTDLSLKFSQ